MTETMWNMTWESMRYVRYVISIWDTCRCSPPFGRLPTAVPLQAETDAWHNHKLTSLNSAAMLIYHFLARGCRDAVLFLWFLCAVDVQKRGTKISFVQIFIRSQVQTSACWASIRWRVPTLQEMHTNATKGSLFSLCSRSALSFVSFLIQKFCSDSVRDLVDLRHQPSRSSLLRSPAVV